MEALAVILENPGELALRRIALQPAGADDVTVAMAWSGISTGTERLLWQGKMPAFPGMGYPLVPGYESAGTVISAGPMSGRKVGDRVFVPGANCYGPVKGLFGGAASKAVLPGRRTVSMPQNLAEDGTLLALAATAMHALAGEAGGAPRLPDLIVGHGVVGRLLARLTLALGGSAPTVWETQSQRRDGDFGYPVVTPESDARRDYQRIVDASGDSDVLDKIIPRLAKGGEVVLAGFYSGRVGFAFPPAFMREARLRIAAEWSPEDMTTVTGLLATGCLSLAGLITHRSAASDAASAYATAFDDPQCLKMVLDWSDIS